MKKTLFDEKCGPLHGRVAVVVSPGDLLTAVGLWNDLAHENGLPRVQRLTEARRRKLKMRLTECGGLEGWRVALNKVLGSTFLKGGNERHWRADFDFVLQEKSFTKLMEGGYDDHGSCSFVGRT